MLKVGLTGGIGSGKSTAAHFFSDLGIPVLDADEINRDISEPGQAGYLALTHHFGESIIDQNGNLDKSQIRRKMLASKGFKHELESILHPIILDIITKKTESLDTPYAIIAVPLLIESGWDKEVDRVLLIDTEEERQIERAAQRDKSHIDEIKQIITLQLDRKNRITAADDIIVNNSTLSDLKDKVSRMHEFYLSLS